MEITGVCLQSGADFVAFMIYMVLLSLYRKGMNGGYLADFPKLFGLRGLRQPQPGPKATEVDTTQTQRGTGSSTRMIARARAEVIPLLLLRAGLGFSRAYLLGRCCSGSPQLASRRQRAVLACSVRARLIAGPGCRKTLTLGLGQLDEPNTRKGSIELSIKAVAIQAELVIAGLCFHARGTPSNITN